MDPPWPEQGRPFRAGKRASQAGTGVRVWVSYLHRQKSQYCCGMLAGFGWSGALVRNEPDRARGGGLVTNLTIRRVQSHPSTLPPLLTALEPSRGPARRMVRLNKCTEVIPRAGLGQRSTPDRTVGLGVATTAFPSNLKISPQERAPGKDPGPAPAIGLLSPRANDPRRQV